MGILGRSTINANNNWERQKGRGGAKGFILAGSQREIELAGSQQRG
jgi:hypothetical protein